MAKGSSIRQKNQPFCDQAKAAETRASRRAAALARQLRCRLQGGDHPPGMFGADGESGGNTKQTKDKSERPQITTGPSCRLLKEVTGRRPFFSNLGRECDIMVWGDKNAGKERRESRTA